MRCLAVGCEVHAAWSVQNGLNISPRETVRSPEVCNRKCQTGSWKNGNGEVRRLFTAVCGACCAFLISRTRCSSLALDVSSLALVFDGSRSFRRWLGFSLNSIGAVVVFFASLFAVLERNAITGGLAGLSVSYAQQVCVRVCVRVRRYVCACSRVGVVSVS